MAIEPREAFPTNATQLSSTFKWIDGDNWDVIPVTDATGVTHVGLRIDFHNQDAKLINVDDYDWRIAAGPDNSSLKFINDGGVNVFEFGDDGNLTMSGNTITINSTGTPIAVNMATLDTGLSDHLALTAEHIDWTAPGAGTIDVSNYTNTEYSVGDGGLTEINFTTAKDSKLTGIEALADVTDATNVNAAGAIMESDVSATPSGVIINDNTMATATASTLATAASIKAYVDGQISSSVTYEGGFNASTGSPALNTITSTQGDMYTVTTAGTYNFTTGSVTLEVGDVLIAETSGVLNNADSWTVVNKNLDAASIKTSYESNADTNAFTDASKNKLDNITVTQAVNLDTIEGWGDHSAQPYAVTNADNSFSNAQTISLADGANPLNLTRTSPTTDQVSMRFTATGSRYFGKGTDDNPYWASAANISAGNMMYHEGNFIAGTHYQAPGSYLTAETDTLTSVVGRGNTIDASVQLKLDVSKGYVLRPKTSTGGWARGLIVEKASDGATLGGVGFLGTNETLTSYHVGFGDQWYATNAVLTLTPAGNLTVDGSVSAGTHVYAPDGVKVDFTSNTKTPMVVLNTAENYGMHYIEGSPDHLVFATANETSNYALDISSAGLTHLGNTVYHSGNFGKTEIDALNIQAGYIDINNSTSSAWYDIPFTAGNLLYISASGTGYSPEFQASTGSIRTYGSLFLNGHTATGLSGSSGTLAWGGNTVYHAGNHTGGPTNASDYWDFSSTFINSSTDLNNITAQGLYRWTGSAPTNAPAGETYTMMWHLNDGGQDIQMVFGGSQNAEINMRRRDSGTYYAWTKFLNEGNFVAGTDYQAAGNYLLDTTDTFTGTLTITGNTTTSAVNGQGYWYWSNTSSYGHYMASVGDNTKGTVAEHFSTDYNIYFRNSGVATRGFVFYNSANSSTPAFEISGTGNTYTSGNAEISGNLDIASSIRHIGETDNTITFTADSISLNPGVSGTVTITSSNDAQLVLNGGSSTYAGIKFDDVNSADYLWYNGTNGGTFAIGGGGSSVSGKKLHVDGGMTVGASSDSVAMPTNGLLVEGPIQANGGIFASDRAGHGRIPMPEGASYSNWSNTITGAIEIQLPAATYADADMMSMWVDIFDYATNESLSMFIAGYMYQAETLNEWQSCTVVTHTNNLAKDFTVRFGAEGSRHKIWIGELASTWSYMTVQVRDVNVHSGTLTPEEYATDWNIVIESTSFGSVDETLSGNLPYAATATWADQVDVNTSSSASWYPITWHAGDTMYSCQTNVEYQPSTGYLSAGRLYVGTGKNDGYFYSDANGRTAFAGGQFYIQSSVSTYYNYATTQFHGGTSGDSHLFRGNTLSGNSWDISAAGAATFASYNTSSDRTLKDNIVKYDPKKASGIIAYEYTFKDDETDKKHIGYIAQDVEETELAHTVKEDNNGKLALDYTSIHTAKIAELEKKVEEQADQINDLKTLVEQLLNK